MVPDIVAFGDNVVDCYADLGLMFPGGNTLNLSVFVRRFGAQSTYIGAIGNDPAGRHILHALGTEDVNLSAIRIIENGRTAFCEIGNKDGERTFLGADLGVSIIKPTKDDLAVIARADVIHTGRSSHIDDFIPIFAQTTKVSFDFAVVRDIDRIASIAPHCFLASFSGSDLSPSQIDEILATCLNAGTKWVLITRGEKGAILANQAGHYSQPAALVNVLDTLGAGDTFIARVLWGLMIDEAPDHILGQAAIEAGKTCQSHGGFGHPAPIEIDRTHARSLSEIYQSAETEPAP